MKVTEVPAQTGLTEADIVTDTSRFGFTTMLTVFEVAGFPLAQAALEVSMQVTISPFAGTYVIVGAEG